MTRDDSKGRGREFTRREVLDAAMKLGLAAGLTPALFGCSTSPSAPAPAAPSGSAPAPAPAAKPAGFDWQKYKGQSIRFFINKNANGETMLKSLPEFEQLTGIKVVAEALPEDQFRQKSVVELASGSGSVDGFMTLIGQDGLKFLKAGWYAPLDPFIKNPDLTDPKWNFPDFTKAALDTQSVQGTLVGMPIALDCEIMYANKELLEKKGLQAPKTLDELEDVAKRLTDKSKGIYGFASRGRRAAAVSMFCSFLWNMGGRWMKGDQPDLASPEAIEAFKFYGHLLRDYGPPGVQNFTFYEVTSAFMEGSVGLATDAASFFAFLEDPAKSKVVGKVTYHPFPKGPKGDNPILYGWGMSLAAQSKKKEPAWLFAQWAANQENAARQTRAGSGSARQSVWDDQSVVGKMNPTLLNAYKHALQNGNSEWVPPVVPVPEVRDIIGDVILTGIEGGDVKAAAEKANKLFVEAVKKAG